MHKQKVKKDITNILLNYLFILILIKFLLLIFEVKLNIFYI
jgi:hypothetical protein